MTWRTSSTERCDTWAVPTTKYFVPSWSSVVTELGSSTSPPYHMLFTTHDYRDSRSDENRDRGRRISPARAALSRPHRCAERRRHEPGRVLSQLLVQVVSRGGGGAGRRAVGSRGARDHLRHAVRRLEGEVPAVGRSTSKRSARASRRSYVRSARR